MLEERNETQGDSETVRTEITEPYVELYRRILQRGLDRDQIRADRAPAIALMAEVIPALSTHRLYTRTEPADRAFYVAVIDEIILPALR